MASERHSASSRKNRRALSRRQMLALTSSAATVGLAGCGSGQDPDSQDVLTTDTEQPQGTDGDTDTQSTQGGEPVTTELNIRAPVSWTPGNSNINPFATQGDIEYWMEYMWWESMAYPNNVGKPIMWLADDIRLENGGCDVVIELNDQYTWWDGSPVTAQDVYTSRMIAIYQEYGGPEEVDANWVVTDDYTLKHELAGPANPDIQKAEYLNIVTKHDYFKSWLQKYEDASGEDAINKVSQELNEHKITLADLTEKGLGCGMWKPTQYDPTEVVHEKYQDHPRADWTNLETFNWVLMADSQKSIQALQSGRFDFGDKMLTQVEQNDAVDTFSQFPISGVPKMVMNFGNKHLARRPVRRAIAYLIDHEELVAVIKGSHGQIYDPHKNSIGMSSSVADEWLSDEFRGNLIEYGLKSNPEKATQTLEDAGYSKDGGNWVGPDGDAIEGLNYLTPPWPIYESIGKYISPKLKEFGIGNKLIVPSSSGFWKSWTETFDFDMCNWFTNASHPASAFSTVSAAGLGKYSVHKVASEPPEGCTVDRRTPELKQETSEKLSHSLRPEFPTEVGAMGLDAETQTLQPFKWTNIMAQTQDEEEVRDLTEKLVWFHNWQLPHIGFYEETKTYWGKTDKFDFPVAGEVDNHPSAEATLAEHTTTAMEYLVKGHISAKTK